MGGHLIYDVGLLDGEDTAYYLFQGHRVLAVDANPTMIDKARTRFATEIGQGRLTLLNVGISESHGLNTFWVCEQAEWSSFDKALASRHNTHQTPVSVQVVPFADILRDYGVPHYLKIDIEGNDRMCIEALSGLALPRYVSVESECTQDSETLSDEQAIAMLVLLRDTGYQRFKLVGQSAWLPVRASGARHLFNRALSSAARGRLQVAGLRTVAQRFTDSARIASLGFNFTPGATGPWGDDVPGPWMSFKSARSAYLREKRKYFESKPQYSFWYDWHATY